MNPPPLQGLAPRISRAFDHGNPTPTVPVLTAPGSAPTVPVLTAPGSTPPGSSTVEPETTSPTEPTATTEVPTAERPTSAAAGTSAPVVGILLLLALLVGIAVGYALRMFQNPSPRTGPAGPAPPTLIEGTSAADAALIDAAIDVRDRTTNPLLADRLGQALAAAGVMTIDPSGHPFDPTSQRAVDHEPTDRSDLDDSVASVERLGYDDRSGRFGRLPEVVVYRYDPNFSPEAGA